MRKPITLIATTGVLALGVAACGGSSSHSTAAASSSSAAATTSAASASPSTSGGAATSKFLISAASSGALQFSSAALKAKAGTVTITFVNQSPEGHNLTVVHGTSGPVVGATPTFNGGSKTLTLHLSAGTYTYYCSVPGHRQAGMQGTLTVS